MHFSITVILYMSYRYIQSITHTSVSYVVVIAEYFQPTKLNGSVQLAIAVLFLFVKLIYVLSSSLDEL